MLLKFKFYSDCRYIVTRITNFVIIDLYFVLMGFTANGNHRSCSAEDKTRESKWDKREWQGLQWPHSKFSNDPGVCFIIVILCYYFCSCVFHVIILYKNVNVSYICQITIQAVGKTKDIQTRANIYSCKNICAQRISIFDE